VSAAKLRSNFLSVNGKFWLDRAGVVATVKRSSTKPLMACALVVEREAKQSMTGASKGIQGRNSAGQYQRRADQPPSAPGSPPHVKTGNLRASISHSSVTAAQTILVGPTREAWYGQVHEFGGKRHPKRPFMLPALQKSQQRFAGLFRGLDMRSNYRPQAGSESAQ